MLFLQPVMLYPYQRRAGPVKAQSKVGTLTQGRTASICAT